MIQYNGSMNLGILQNRIQQGLQSKSQTAKKNGNSFKFKSPSQNCS